MIEEENPSFGFIMSYERQSRSLRNVQIKSRALEKGIRTKLSELGIPNEGGQGVVSRYGNVHPLARLQVDIAVPEAENPETLFFVTYTEPDKPGHSNENKLHLKLGELFLFKTFNPQLRCVLVVGEKEESWLGYVLRAFRVFFDQVIFTWEPDLGEKLSKSLNSDLRNMELWKAEKQKRDSTKLETDEEFPPASDYRSRFYRKVVRKYLGSKEPTMIRHPILQRMAVKSHQDYSRTGGKKGLLWKHLTLSDFPAIWQERSYFNPMEETVEFVLERERFDFTRSLNVPTLLAGLGLPESRATEDFGLYSQLERKPVYIQCKASAGGEEQHGKNIMNRSKEQIARSLLYRCRAAGENRIESRLKEFIWISVLDGNWKLPQRYPLKYIHMLQIAGYDYVFRAADLVETEDLMPKENSPFLQCLDGLECKKQPQTSIVTSERG